VLHHEVRDKGFLEYMADRRLARDIALAVLERDARDIGLHAFAKYIEYCHAGVRDCGGCDENG